ncbi:hypothetical protein ABBQ38_009354 [Trebouxia sp. C0009 RCD-2024]
MSDVDGVVFGAGGGVGFECVQHLLGKGNSVRAVVRSPEKYKDKFPKSDLLTVAKGDVTDAASIKDMMQGAKGAIFAASGSTYWSASSVDFQGVEKVAEAATGKQRVVLCSSALVTPKNRWNPIRIILNNVRWALMDNKFKGEWALRNSGKSFTIVRPGGLTNAAGGESKLITGQGDDMKPGSVSRADVAAVMVAALTTDAADKITFELSSDKSEKPTGPPTDIFTGLKQGVFE